MSTSEEEVEIVFTRESLTQKKLTKRAKAVSKGADRQKNQNPPNLVPDRVPDNFKSQPPFSGGPVAPRNNPPSIAPSIPQQGFQNNPQSRQMFDSPASSSAVYQQIVQPGNPQNNFGNPKDKIEPNAGLNPPYAPQQSFLPNPSQFGGSNLPALRQDSSTPLYQQSGTPNFGLPNPVNPVPAPNIQNPPKFTQAEPGLFSANNQKNPAPIQNENPSPGLGVTLPTHPPPPSLVNGVHGVNTGKVESPGLTPKANVGNPGSSFIPTQTMNETLSSVVKPVIVNYPPANRNLPIPTPQNPEGIPSLRPSFITQNMQDTKTLEKMQEKNQHEVLGRQKPPELGSRAVPGQNPLLLNSQVINRGRLPSPAPNKKPSLPQEVIIYPANVMPVIKKSNPEEMVEDLNEVIEKLIPFLDLNKIIKDKQMISLTIEKCSQQGYTQSRGHIQTIINKLKCTICKVMSPEIALKCGDMFCEGCFIGCIKVSERLDESFIKYSCSVCNTELRQSEIDSIPENFNQQALNMDKQSRNKIFKSQGQLTCRKCCKSRQLFADFTCMHMCKGCIADNIRRNNKHCDFCKQVFQNQEYLVNETQVCGGCKATNYIVGDRVKTIHNDQCILCVVCLNYSITQEICQACGNRISKMEKLEINDHLFGYCDACNKEIFRGEIHVLGCCEYSMCKNCIYETNNCPKCMTPFSV